MMKLFQRFQHVGTDMDKIADPCFFQVIHAGRGTGYHYNGSVFYLFKYPGGNFGIFLVAAAYNDYLRPCLLYTSDAADE